ncbi:DinB family protein [Chromobacterium sphagni]|uniref:DinB family protein n=1 Tax=Chromobacterium sphagni TaxID=1903179 RepID=UPI000A704BEF|nr:DinB family protein [Chromobacterium sphagni]
MSTSSLLTSLFRYKAWANDELFAAAAALEDGAHAEALHGVIRILNHIHVVDSIFAAHLQGGNMAMPPPIPQKRPHWPICAPR